MSDTYLLIIENKPEWNNCDAPIHTSSSYDLNIWPQIQQNQNKELSSTKPACCFSNQQKNTANMKSAGVKDLKGSLKLTDVGFCFKKNEKKKEKSRLKRVFDAIRHHLTTRNTRNI